MAHTSKKKELEAQFLEAYEMYANDIFRFVAFKTSDREVAQDLLQETFTKTWDYCRSGNEVKKWKQFLFRTAYNLVIDTYRKKRAISLDALMEAGFSPEAGGTDAPNPTEHAEIVLMRNAIDKLDDTYRDIILLRYTENLSPAEIADILNLSENVVSVRIHRGIKKLRTHLGEGKNV